MVLGFSENDGLCHGHWQAQPLKLGGMVEIVLFHFVDFVDNSQNEQVKLWQNEWPYQTLPSLHGHKFQNVKMSMLFADIMMSKFHVSSPYCRFKRMVDLDLFRIQSVVSVTSVRWEFYLEMLMRMENITTEDTSNKLYHWVTWNLISVQFVKLPCKVR